MRHGGVNPDPLAGRIDKAKEKKFGDKKQPPANENKKTYTKPSKPKKYPPAKTASTRKKEDHRNAEVKNKEVAKKEKQETSELTGTKIYGNQKISGEGKVEKKKSEPEKMRKGVGIYKSTEKHGGHYAKLDETKEQTGLTEKEQNMIKIIGLLALAVGLMAVI